MSVQTLVAVYNSGIPFMLPLRSLHAVFLLCFSFRFQAKQPLGLSLGEKKTNLWANNLYLTRINVEHSCQGLI